jgi:hypothetical protein
VLVVLAVPFAHVSFTGVDSSILPASSSAGIPPDPGQFRSVFRGTRWPLGRLRPGHAGPPGHLRRRRAAVPGVKAVSVFQHLGGSLWESDVALASAPLSPAAQRAVEAVQAPARGMSPSSARPLLTCQSRPRRPR